MEKVGYNLIQEPIDEKCDKMFESFVLRTIFISKLYLELRKAMKVTKKWMLLYQVLQDGPVSSWSMKI